VPLGAAHTRRDGRNHAFSLRRARLRFKGALLSFSRCARGDRPTTLPWVLVTGEPGISKSRIAEALHERLASEKDTRLRYFCSPLTKDPRVRRARNLLLRELDGKIDVRCFALKVFRKRSRRAAPHTYIINSVIDFTCALCS